MSLYRKALFSGLGRIITLPRLSVPLIITLGMTLGAVLTVIAMSSALLYKPLQGVSNEENIQTLSYKLHVSDGMDVSYWSLHRLAAFNEAFKDIGVWAAINSYQQDVNIDNLTYATTAHDASDTILQVLGTKLIAGEDVSIDKPENYVWISNSLWQQAYSGQKSALGKQVSINSKNYRIAGVIEDLMAVTGNNEAILAQQIWHISNLKASLSEQETGRINADFDNLLLKRRNASVVLPTEQQIAQWMERFIHESLSGKQAEGYLGFLKSMKKIYGQSDYRSTLLGDSKSLLLTLFIAVLGLLLMATLNLLNIFLAHYQGRTKEFAIQLSLGASLMRLRLLVLLENLPSFALAAVLGLLVSAWLIKSIPLIAGDNFPLLDSINIDTFTVLSSLTLVLLLNLLFSALALLDIDKQALANNLNSSGKGIQAQSNQWLSRGLMVLQLAIASLLLTASVMLASQSYKAVYRDLGYDIGNSYDVSWNIDDEQWTEQLNKYEHYQGSELQGLHQSLSQLLQQSVAGSEVIIPSFGPLANQFSVRVHMPKDKPGQRILFQDKYLSPGYFKAFHIPMLAGSNLSEQQIAEQQRRIVIDEKMANTMFPGIAYADIIDKPLQLQDEDKDGNTVAPYIVNGIVASTQSMAGKVDAMQMPVVYSPEINGGSSVHLTVMMPAGESLTAEMLETAFSKQFPRLHDLKVKSLQSIWSQQTQTQRVSLYLVLTMTGLTLLLAAIGVAGLTQMTTNHRKYELAVRMATGASQAKLVNFILKDALWMLAAGLGLGFVLSVFSYQQLQSVLDMLPTFSWLTMSILDAGLLTIVLTAVLVPAWQVIKADPMQALRVE